MLVITDEILELLVWINIFGFMTVAVIRLARIMLKGK